MRSFLLSSDFLDEEEPPAEWLWRVCAEHALLSVLLL